MYLLITYYSPIILIKIVLSYFMRMVAQDKKKKKLIRTVLVSILFIIGFIITFIIAKEAVANKLLFDHDESLTMSLANDHRMGWLTFENHGWFAKSFYQNYIVTDYPFQFKEVIAWEIEDNHPPLYYLLINIISSFHQREPLTVSMMLELNVWCFLINYIIVYWFTYRCTKSSIFAFIMSMVFVTNPYNLEMLVMIRMYQLVSTFSLLFMAAGMSIVFFKEPWYIALALAIVGGGMTHYFFYYAMLLLCVCFAVVLIVQKRWKTLGLSIGTVLIAVGFNFWIFPAVFTHVFSETAPNGNLGREALSGLSNIGNTNTFRAFTYFDLTWGGKYVFYLMCVLSIIIGIFLLFLQTKKGKRLKIRNTRKQLLVIGWICIFTSCINVYLVSQTASYLYARYLAMMEGIGMVGLFLLFAAIPKNLGIIPIIVLSILLYQPHYLKRDPNVVFSVDYAKSHNGPVVVVLKEELFIYEVCTSFMDFMEYSSVGITHYEEPFPNHIEGDFTVYYTKDLDVKDVQKYLEKEINKKVEWIEHPEVPTSYYYVLEAKEVR